MVRILLDWFFLFLKVKGCDEFGRDVLNLEEVRIEFFEF